MLGFITYLVVGGLLFVKVVFFQYLFITLEGGGTGSCLLSTFLLLSTRYVTYLVETFHFIIIIDVGICRFSRSYVLVCMSPLNVMLITMRV